MKRFFLAAVLFLAASAVFISCESTQIENANSNWEFVEPEDFSLLASGKSKITLKTNAPKAAVYINKEYYGLTPLEINDLIPGDYFVTIKKEEYKTMQIAIQIKDGISDYYYLEMELDLEDEE